VLGHAEAILAIAPPTGYGGHRPLDFCGLRGEVFGVFPGQPDGVDFFGFGLATSQSQEACLS